MMRRSWQVVLFAIGVPLPALATPITPTPAQIQSLIDQTAVFSGNRQFSSVNSITNIANGIEVDATFRVGDGDPSDPNSGQSFARISLQSVLAPHLDWSAFDCLELTITHSTGSAFIQPFVQTGASLLFHEPALGGFSLSSTLPTDIVMNFDDLRIFSPYTEHVSLADPDDVGAWGVQVITNGVTVLDPLDVIFRIESISRSVAEPAGWSMIILGVVALAAVRRR